MNEKILNIVEYLYIIHHQRKEITIPSILYI